VPSPRRFAYYDRLSADEKATYRRSDALDYVEVPDAVALGPLVRGIEVALFSGVRAKVAKATSLFVSAFLAQLGAPDVKVHVREVRPDLEDAELHGLYTFATEDEPPKVEVWMRTRAHAQVVKFRTFLRTVIHEVLHHLDVEAFGLEDSFHTQGFFRRESSIVRQLLGESPRAPRAPRPPREASSTSVVQPSLFDAEDDV